MNNSIHPFAGSKISEFLAKRIADFSGRKTEREIAAEAGFKSLNIVNMMKKGGARVPLDRVAGLARALETDEALMFRLALEQFMPEGSREMAIGNSIFTENEIAIINLIREASGNTDPGLNDQRREGLAKLFG